jgi:hypothetical protein
MAVVAACVCLVRYCDLSENSFLESIRASLSLLETEFSYPMPNFLAA